MSELIGRGIQFMWLNFFFIIIFYFLAFKWLSKWSKTTDIGQRAKEVSKGVGHEVGKVAVSALMNFVKKYRG